MTMTQYNAFEGEDWAAMSTAQFAALQAVTPVVLDLNGDGVQTLAAADGVSFDLTGLGQAAQVGWASAQDGLLVRDINGDGSHQRRPRALRCRHRAGQRAHVPATATARWPRWTATPTASSAPQTTKFSELKLWVDADSDGITDAGELKGLVDFGVVEINLDFAKGTRAEQRQPAGPGVQLHRRRRQPARHGRRVVFTASRRRWARAGRPAGRTHHRHRAPPGNGCFPPGGWRVW
jgi:hypothetical protein